MTAATLEMVEFDRLSGYIESALEYAGGTHTVDDVRDLVSDGSLQLWPAKSSVVLTQLVEYPQLRECLVFLAAGNLGELRDIYPFVIEWAKGNQCKRITTWGRRGWERTFLTREKGWEPGLVHFVKELD